MNSSEFQSSDKGRESVDVRLTVIYDNNPYVRELQASWGFACLVQIGECSLLFDTGGNGAVLLRNMQKLRIAPTRIKQVVISHIHTDHFGGLKQLMERNPRLPVYIPKSAPMEVTAQIELWRGQAVRVGSLKQLGPNAYALGEFRGFVPELALVIQTAKGLVVVTGCAHPGILNIVRKARFLFPEYPVHLVLGGFHLGGLSVANTSEIVGNFQKLGVQTVAPCHCSGETARMLFNRTYGENSVALGVGGIIQIKAFDEEMTKKCPMEN